MKLSVIIVNFNVCYFLDQALSSVLQSDTDFDFEIFVVDNGSDDGSVGMVKEKYPEVYLLETGENLGFAKANNIAAAKCRGEYILLLNPDTIVKEDTLQKCIEYLSKHPKSGALGVKMHDGSGTYLPESKRGFPGPWTAFFKITGLNTLFSNSRLFNYYYLGHLPNDKNQTVDVLTGAFMMLKKEQYIDLKGLDEDFFMYGEDIDLCYRLHEKGFENHYLASSSIIHFKGESTSKHTVKYIKTFYNAMSIYARKHYTKQLYAFLSVFIQMAIYGRATVAILAQRLKSLFPALKDTIFIAFLAYFPVMLLDVEASFVEVLLLSPVGPVIWHLINAYNRKFQWWKFLGSAMVILVAFSVLAYLLSSGILLFTAIATVGLVVLKTMYRSLSGEGVFLPSGEQGRVAGIISDSSGERSIRKLMDLLIDAPRRYKVYDRNLLSAWWRNKKEGPPEIIFDPKVVSWDMIVDSIIELGPTHDFRILSLDNKALITSLSKNETASIVTESVALQKHFKDQLKLKYRFDVIFSMAILLLFPYFILSGNGKYLRRALRVLKGDMTWVGFEELSQDYNLAVKKSFFNYGEELQERHKAKMAQLIYMRTYHPIDDWRYVMKNS